MLSFEQLDESKTYVNRYVRDKVYKRKGTNLYYKTNSPQFKTWDISYASKIRRNFIEHDGLYADDSSVVVNVVKNKTLLKSGLMSYPV